MSFHLIRLQLISSGFIRLYSIPSNQYWKFFPAVFDWSLLGFGQDSPSIAMIPTPFASDRFTLADSRWRQICARSTFHFYLRFIIFIRVMRLMISWLCFCSSRDFQPFAFQKEIFMGDFVRVFIEEISKLFVWLRLLRIFRSSFGDCRTILALEANFRRRFPIVFGSVGFSVNSFLGFINSGASFWLIRSVQLFFCLLALASAKTCNTSSGARQWNAFNTPPIFPGYFITYLFTYLLIYLFTYLLFALYSLLSLSPLLFPSLWLLDGGQNAEKERKGRNVFDWRLCELPCIITTSYEITFKI